MRKQILGATAAILGASVLSIGLPAAPTQGAAWKSSTQIPFPAGAVTDVEVVSTGPGDAVAAAVINGAVHAYTAVNGVWTGHAQVRGDVDATGLVLASSGKGDVAVGWKETVSGDVRLRVSRQVTATSWTGLQLLTPAGTDISGAVDLGIAGNGLVLATAAVDDEDADIDQQLIVTEWSEGKLPGSPQVLSSSEAWSPSLDVNTKGEALISYTFTGLIDNVVTVVRRTPGQGWNLGDSTQNSGNVAAAPDVAISENGQGQVIYGVVNNGVYVAETSRVLADGTALPAEFASPFDEFISEPSVDINASGSALFTWVAKKDGTTSVRYSTAANGAYPGGSQKLTGTAPDAVDPTARITDAGLRVIQHSGNGQVVTHTRAGTVQPWVPVYTGNGFSADDSMDVDREGNAVQVAFKPAGGIQGRFFDAAGPTVTLAALPLNTLDTTIPAKWTMQDSLSTIPNSDVYATTAAWNEGGHGTPSVIVDNVAGTQADIPATPGTSYCIQVRPTDAAGNSATTEKRCTTLPLDDRALNGPGWKELKETGNFRNTLTTTTVKGRTLSRSGVKAKRLALVVRRANNGGTVKVTFAGQVLGSYSLQGTGKKKVIKLKTFPTVKTGKLTIRVTSATGKRVKIDGVIVAK